MYQLLESIRIENRVLHNIELHNKRFNMARKALWNQSNLIDLRTIIDIPEELNDERYKCRIVSNKHTINFEIKPYVQRKIETLKVIVDNKIDYTYKTSNRTLLDKAFEQRNNCDDIIIIKNNLVTDTWAANLILFNGEKWLTPKKPLLKGTQREYLLSIGKIHEQNIHLADIKNFETIKLINAMIDFDRAPEINVEKGVIY